ncbi:MAG: phosphoheptose isomerase [Flavobacteriaceae bacterium]|jgi:mannose-6-phosphate isomerase|nr:phosphoheptose isomerase [Flavobacteriaceae bacterium]|tara:strand:- start:188 stop:667 length:480 start_codon:yes stop_codon:yes gene_type:complete
MTDLLLGTKKEIESLGFNIISYDFNRPWGGFLLIDESQSKEFISKFISNENLKIENKVSPKILIVNPNSRLSWQYHNRRKEIWKVFKNEVGVIKSTDNNETEMKIFNVGDVIELQKGERHRLIGLSNFGIVAEIWIHTDPTNPSDENDIVRLQDDYARD